MINTIPIPKQRHSQVIIAILLVTTWLPLTSYAVEDTDGDGILDNLDNCIEIANLDQRNTDADIYGNLCDGDLNNDDKTNTLDLNLYKLAHRTEQGDSTFNPNADFNGDGKVNTLDLNIYKTLHRKPPGPSGIVDTLTTTKAARFLTQSTFGPTLQDINYLVDESGSFEAWLNEQFSKPTTLQLPAMRAMEIKMCRVDSAAPPAVAGGYRVPRAQVWWETAVNGNDQLRQRVALALSEILVVSAQSPIYYSQYGLASYYDVLARNAFGNFRDLIEEVTLHPAMGWYLGMLRNEKADPSRNILPDENYAREIMQLFTIGVHQLNIDGSLVLDAQNKPIPTYGQQEVEEFAKVFTGWGFADDQHWRDVWIQSGDIVHPMKAFEPFHDTSEKQLLNDYVITAGGTAKQDLDKALDNLFAHQNVAPFISKQLIHRLVTSNPSKGYVERVAKVFNGIGVDDVKGDLKAVVRAILLDDEARNGHQNIPEKFGKLREPMLRITHLWRAFPIMPVALEGACGQGEYDFYRIPFGGGLKDFDVTLGQTILRSPTVFNFFLPDHSPQGILRDQKLVAPEFQVITENTLVNASNAIVSMVHHSNRHNGYSDWTTIDTTQEVALANTPNELLDHLNLVLLNNQMSTEMRQILLNHLNQTFSGGEIGRQARVRDAITLILDSPEYLIQQ